MDRFGYLHRHRSGSAFTASHGDVGPEGCSGMGRQGGWCGQEVTPAEC